MLTADLVLVRRRGDALELRKLSKDQHARMLAAAEAFVAIVSDHVGRSLSELQRRWGEVEVEATDFKLLKGLRKLLEDRCTFEAAPGLDPVAVRQAVFTAAARHRRELGDEEKLDVEKVLAEAAPAFVGRAGPREPWLFGDLTEHQLLTKFERIDAAQLVATYEWAQKQAVLLRAVSVTVALLSPETAGARNLFRQLKFRRLLYTLKNREGGGYTIEIDGPFSLFSAVTKYGLNLALLLPTLDECGPWTLDARVRWDKTPKQYQFHVEGGQAPGGTGAALLSDDVAALVAQVTKNGRGWKVAPTDAILDLPGVGLCIPDLAFEHPETAEPFYLEVMGFWSRDAVWKRVELVQAGLDHAILFAVSARLRVSEKVLDGDLPGQLYVYKGTMLASQILERLEALRAARPARPVKKRAPRKPKSPATGT